MAATDVLELVGSIAGAVLAAGGSSLLVLSQYQAAQRKKQPVLLKATDWTEVVSAQKTFLTLLDDKIVTMSPSAQATGSYQRLSDIASAVKDWKGPNEVLDPILALRQGRKAFTVYRSINTPLSHLDKLTAREMRRHPLQPRPGGFRTSLSSFIHGQGDSFRFILRSDVESRVRRIIKRLSRAQKYLVEISYLQPDLLLKPSLVKPSPAPDPGAQQ
jgi:hypothetical protein